MPQLKFKFDPNQPHQIKAIESVVGLFDGLPKGDTSFKLGDDVVPNLPPHEALEEGWLAGNLNTVRNKNNLPDMMSMDFDDGLGLPELGVNPWRYPSFTIEMETATGKTYVYLRTIYELSKNYGFRKFIIVVPSIAIYEGVIKAYQITKEHFKTLYGNEHVPLIVYDGQHISQLKSFASSTYTNILLITLDSFNKAKNVIYKPTEKLMGEKLPYEYLQETRPILILDECQNYLSEISKQALRTLHPLLALRYSATPKENPNPLYILNPVEAFKMNLVKRIEVYGVRELNNFNKQVSLALERITPGLKAKVKLLKNIKGRLEETVMELKQGDDLFTKTHNDNYRGMVVEEIDARRDEIIFTNQNILALRDSGDTKLSKKEIFRRQIEETVLRHFTKQEELAEKGIKVLSLFFIDKVASYRDANGVVRELFDEIFEKHKKGYKFFAKHQAEEVRDAYFAQKRDKKGNVEEIDLPDEKKNQAERELEKAAYELIMKNKEKLLSFDEKVSFIFAHSALKEGWDNPNVFQICTLRDTQSKDRKRQEIGRGLRLCVDQEGNRINDEQINILTVVANDSYENYVQNLQQEYVEDGEAQAPPKPTNARGTDVKRNSKIFGSPEFQGFWDKLAKITEYEINIDTAKYIKDCTSIINTTPVPNLQLVVTRGEYVITRFELHLEEVDKKLATIRVEITSTRGLKHSSTQKLTVGDDLAKITRNDLLKGYRIIAINEDGEDSTVEFSNTQNLQYDSPLIEDTEKGQKVDETRFHEAQESYPVFNLIDRAKNETGLTRSTVLAIFKGVNPERKKKLFKNPEGFAGMFISVLVNQLSQHIVNNINYIITKRTQKDRLEELFPAKKRYPQKETIRGSKKSLYDMIQIDSDVEQKFVADRLNKDENIVLYFKFPGGFKINIPKIIGNYNPDWGIVRLDDSGKYKLELVRETKGGANPQLLRFPNEARKISCAQKHFKAIGVDYKHIGPDDPYWWSTSD